MEPLKMHFLLNMGIIHCYVSLPGGISRPTSNYPTELFVWCTPPKKHLFFTEHLTQHNQKPNQPTSTNPIHHCWVELPKPKGVARRQEQPSTTDSRSQASCLGTPMVILPMIPWWFFWGNHLQRWFHHGNFSKSFPNKNRWAKNDWKNPRGRGLAISAIFGAPFWDGDWKRDPNSKACVTWPPTIGDQSRSRLESPGGWPVFVFFGGGGRLGCWWCWRWVILFWGGFGGFGFWGWLYVFLFCVFFGGRRGGWGDDDIHF